MNKLTKRMENTPKKNKKKEMKKRETQTRTTNNTHYCLKLARDVKKENKAQPEKHMF